MPGVTGARMGHKPHPSSSTEGSASVEKEMQRAQLPDEGILPRVRLPCLNDVPTTPLKGFTTRLVVALTRTTTIRLFFFPATGKRTVLLVLPLIHKSTG